MIATIKDIAQLIAVWVALGFGLTLGAGLAWTVLVTLWGWM